MEEKDKEKDFEKKFWNKLISSAKLKKALKSKKILRAACLEEIGFNRFDYFKKGSEKTEPFKFYSSKNTTSPVSNLKYALVMASSFAA